MGMSVGGGGGVKAEPNVVPMIDIMLVLLIIFMVVTPALPLPTDIPISNLLKKKWGAAYCEIGLDAAACVLNSRVKRDRPNSPETPLMR